MFCSKREKDINVAPLHIKKVIIWQKIKEFRCKNSLTQKQVADLLGVSPQSVSKWERQESYPDITFLPLLAAVLECRIDDFFA